jgi:hypothetical protein
MMRKRNLIRLFFLLSRIETVIPLASSYHLVLRIGDVELSELAKNVYFASMLSQV